MVVSLYFGEKKHVSNWQNVSFKEPCLTIGAPPQDDVHSMVSLLKPELGKDTPQILDCNHALGECCIPPTMVAKSRRQGSLVPKGGGGKNTERGFEGTENLFCIFSNKQ